MLQLSDHERVNIILHLVHVLRVWHLMQTVYS